ncbi:antitoxin Xre/MbcA/ParS toxin-binding domain-containing protein [Aeromonas popoffii]|uniref:antitoxin Xre/MbcA/ParS toxin-binding domain-containing protein n=1 Tax=Aeromonas popoffii TaxID=70856 RepID=UPI000A03D15F|nr:antitoxin Xre/MbcA/ParS toxin-binding domain-containing protein [Aeromonas popoffii]
MTFSARSNNPRSTAHSLTLSLGIPSDPLGIHSWIVAGIAPGILVRLIESVRSDMKTICHLTGISQSTVNRKLRHGTPLTLVQGTRVYGVIQALDAAISLHDGDLAMAMSWLHCSAKGLGGEKPTDVLATPMGVQAVVELIGRIEHGIVP